MASCNYIPATLKKRVTIQNVIRVSDGQGGFSETWASGATVYASIDPVKSYERYQAQQIAVPVSHKIVMRYNATLDETSRLRYGDRIFSVKEVINEGEENRFLTIKAIEIESVAFVPDIGAIVLRSGGFLVLRGGGNILLRA